MSRTLRIESLGRQGDGIAEDGAFVPFTLPGETVRVSGDGARAVLEAVETASPARQAPICRHFGTCGGCQLQHLREGDYLEWKRGLVVEALAREQIEAPVGAILSFGAHARRRVVLSAIRAGGGALLGFTQRQSNRIVDMAQCPVLTPAIEAALPDLREMARILAPAKGAMKLSVTACANGLDVAARNGTFTPEKAKQAAIALAARMDLARLSLEEETLLAPRRPVLAAGRALVTPPPGAFVQAVEAAEVAMAALVTGHLAPARHAADLFCGFGAFALRMAENSTVLAAESSQAALDALTRAWRETGGALKEVTVDRRDLARRPLMAAEMKKLDAVAFDPPRAGAEEQAREIAASGVPLVAAVSCNPVTLARDLRILVDGGYRVASVTPVDQFVFTAHVEAVALLER